MSRLYQTHFVVWLPQQLYLFDDVNQMDIVYKCKRIQLNQNKSKQFAGKNNSFFLSFFVCQFEERHWTGWASETEWHKAKFNSQAHRFLSKFSVHWTKYTSIHYTNNPIGFARKTQWHNFVTLLIWLRVSAWGNECDKERKCWAKKLIESKE